MNFLRSAGVVLVTAVALTVFTANADAQTPRRYQTYARTMSEHGMAALIPATSDFGPGYIYRLVETGQGANRRLTPRTVCTNAFLTPPREITTRLPNTHRFADDGFNASVSLSPGAVAQNVSGSLAGQLSNVRTVDMTFGQLMDYEVAEANRFDVETNTVVERRLNPACQTNLALLRTSNRRFRDRVFLVVRSTAPQSFTYTLNGDAGGSINISPTIENVATGTAGWRIRRVNQQSFSVVRDLAGSPQAPQIFVAAQIMRLPSVAGLGEVGTSVTPRLTVAPVTPADLSPLLPRR